MEVLLGDERLERRERERLHGNGGPVGPAGRRPGAHDAIGVGQEGDDLLEPQRARYALADDGEDFVE